jgi:malate/lactate dehydrogenase
MQRADLLEKNRQIFVVQGQALDKVAKKTCKSIVIANPVKNLKIKYLWKKKHE